MAKQNEPRPKSNDTAQVPDPATSYERAKPQQQSPGGSLKQSEPPESAKPDKLQKNDAPAKPEKR